jgi:hypothetical protein
MLGSGSQIGASVGAFIGGITSNPSYLTYVNPYLFPIGIVTGFVVLVLWQHTWKSKIKPKIPFINKTSTTPMYQNQPTATPPQVIPQQPTPQPVPIVVEQPKKEVEK